MKHWQFFLAILILLISLIPIYESYSKHVVDEINLVEKDVDKNTESINKLTNELAEFRTEQYNANFQMGGSNDISNYLSSHPYPYPAKLQDGAYAFTGGRANKYCADEGNKIVCNRDGYGPWEKMQLTNLGEGKYSIKGGKDGKYCADEGHNIICNRDGIGQPEIFKIIDIGEGYYNVIGGYSNYIGSKDIKYCSDDSTFICNKNKPGVKERIKITPILPANLPTGTYAFTGGRSNKYCADEGNRMVCNRDAVGPWEKMELTNLGDGNYSIKGGRDGKYCADEGNNNVVCNRDGIGQPEIFKIMDIGKGYYNVIGGYSNFIGSNNIKYCSDDNIFLCNKDVAGINERIKITPV